MRNLDNFRQAVESPKRWNSVGYICLKTTFLHLKHYLHIYLTLLSTGLWVGKLLEEYGKFFPGLSKLGFWWEPLIPTWKSMSLKSTEALSVMTMKSCAKFEEELTCHFKGISLIWGIWRIFPRALESLINFHFNGFHLNKVYIVWTKKVQRSHLSWNWRWIETLERNRYVVSKLAKGIWQILTWALKRFKSFHFNELLFCKVYKYCSS